MQDDKRLQTIIWVVGVALVLTLIGSFATVIHASLTTH
jgi:hypothetical protein